MRYFFIGFMGKEGSTFTHGFILMEKEKMPTKEEIYDELESEVGYNAKMISFSELTEEQYKVLNTDQ